jgi:hypothetical protein
MSKARRAEETPQAGGQVAGAQATAVGGAKAQGAMGARALEREVSLAAAARVESIQGAQGRGGRVL